MNIVALTIFPELFDSFLAYGIIRRAIDSEKVSVCPVNIRNFTRDRHRSTDDRPFGGGSGMVMTPEPLALAIENAKSGHPGAKTVLLTPAGQVFDQNQAVRLSREQDLILVCGRYEGVDERICQEYIDEEISIGDYVLTGGELPAMVVIEAVIRHIPGVLGGEDSAEKDSFTRNLLEHAHFTRPRTFNGSDVPDDLVSGNHKAIEQWRLESAMIRTFLKRRDLLTERLLSPEEINVLKKWCRDIESIIQAQSVSGAGTLPGDKQGGRHHRVGGDKS